MDISDLDLVEDRRHCIVCPSRALKPLAPTLIVFHKISTFLVREWKHIVLHYGSGCALLNDVYRALNRPKGMLEPGSKKEYWISPT